MTIDDIISPAWTAEEARHICDLFETLRDLALGRGQHGDHRLHICDLFETLRDVIWRVHSRAIHAHLEQLNLRAAFEAEQHLDV